MKKSIFVSFAAFVAVPMAFAADLNNNGDITATNQHDVKATRNLIANQVVSAGSAVNSSNTIWAAGAISTNSTIYAANQISTNVGFSASGTSAYIYAPGTSAWVWAGGAGYIGDFLRVGGAANTPASKSVQIGQYATTDSFNSLVVGQYNVNKAKDGVTTPSPTAWRDGTGSTPIDPLFVVGTGTSTTPKNAFTVYKDGTITMSQAQGDISMGQFAY